VNKGQTPAATQTATTQGNGRVTAPMPGRVVRVLVAVGDKVTARQPVVVMEAMKMENELRADRDGSVTQVLVQEGMAVDTGAVLVIVQ
jgi:biotin carboxyl carrier protein